MRPRMVAALPKQSNGGGESDGPPSPLQNWWQRWDVNRKQVALTNALITFAVEGKWKL